MRAQKYINLLKQAYFHLKSLKLLYFVPIAGLFLLLPFLSIGHILSFGKGENAFYQTFLEMQRYIPFLASWWVIFGLREYAEGEGKELLSVYKHSLLPDFFLLFIWYMVHVALLFTLYGIFYENYWLDFLLFFIQALVFAGMTFFLMIVCKTIAVPFLVNIFYEIFCMYSNMEFLRYINMISVPRIAHITDLALPYLPLLFFALLFIFTGDRFYTRNFFLHKKSTGM